jgi:hypothetical protein
MILHILHKMVYIRVFMLYILNYKYFQQFLFLHVPSVLNFTRVIINSFILSTIYII